MECKFCGTSFNAHNCPNCGAAAHQPPEPELSSLPKGEGPPEIWPRQPVFHSNVARQRQGGQTPYTPPKNRKRRGMPMRFGLAMLVPLFFLSMLPRVLVNLNSGNSAAASAPPTGASAPAVGSAAAQSGNQVETPADLYAGTLAFQTLPEEGYKAQATFLDYDAVKRNPGVYASTDMYITLQLTQVDENEAGVIRYIGVASYPDGTWPEEYEARYARRVVVYDRDNNGTRYYKNEYMTVYGDFTGVEEFQAALAGSFACPVMNGRYFALAEVAQEDT